MMLLEEFLTTKNVRWEKMMVQEKRAEKKNLFLFLSGKFVSLLGSQMYGFAMGLYILRLTGVRDEFCH